MSAVSLKVMAEAKGGGVQKTTQFKVDPRIIEIEPGFNARELDPEHVASIAQAYKDGAVLPPLFVRVEDGRVIVVDGHHRLEALMTLINDGAEILGVDCIQFRGNDADRVALLLTSAAGKPLTPLELGTQYKRLANFGWEVSAIASRVGKSRQHVNDMLLLAGSNSDVLGMVKRNEVAAHIAVKTVRKLGGAAGAALSKNLAAAQSEGKKKVTRATMARHVKIAPQVNDKDPASMSLVAAIQREISTKGVMRAEDSCPEWAHLVTYLRATTA